MDYEHFRRIGDQARFRGKLPPEDQEFIRDTGPLEFCVFPEITLPSRLKYPIEVLLKSICFCASESAHQPEWYPANVANHRVVG